MSPVVDHLFRATCALYAGALAAYLGTLATARARVAQLASGLAFAGLIAHSGWILARWYLAAASEVSAARALGESPGWAGAFFAHPPLTNLYESLVITAWCVVAIYLAVEARWKLRPVGVVALGVALAALAEAFVVTEKGLRPLAPALQSWWLIAHVVILFVAYALFLVAAALAVLSLVKGGTPLAALGVGFSVATAAVLLATGLAHGLGHLSFELTPLYSDAGTWQSALYVPAGSTRLMRWDVPVPFVGPLLALTVLLFITAAVAFVVELKAGKELGRGLKAMAGAWVALAACLITLAAQVLVVGPFDASPPEQALQAGVHGPFKLSFQGNYGLGLLLLPALIAAAFLAMAALRARWMEKLPDRARLEDMTYRLVLIAFPMLGFGIVMGAFWAYDAWGSYWSWDPKETWSLVTFLVYALFLHTRRTIGWTGRRTAIIAIIGFALVIFTYLGVNLGLTGEGLHTYGGG
jgi:cytochrome c-type biogenesis protein CcsB